MQEDQNKTIMYILSPFILQI